MSKTSKPEASVKDYLLRHGWVHQPNTLLPFTFKDREGTHFNAMADYYHPVYDVWLEIKDACLNGLKVKRTADKQSEAARLRPAYAKHPTYFQIKNGWNHSVHKQAIVQSTIGVNKFMVLFAGKPNAENIKRITNNGLHAYSFRKFPIWFMGVKIRHWNHCRLAT